MTTKTVPSKVEEVGSQAEMVLAGRDFVYFLDFVHILERAQPLKGIVGGKVKFVKWPHLVSMAKDFVTYRQITVLKARQIGFSWIVAAYSCWLLRFHKGANILELSQGQFEAHELMEKVRYIYNNLPVAWQVPFKADSRTMITIPALEAQIMALPSTEDAGRSETYTLVVQDEAERHEFLNENFMAVKPTIDAGGQLIMGSTVDKKTPKSLFKMLILGAPGNGWHKIFHPWDVRPDRNARWYAETKAAIPETEQLTPDLYMESEYPASEEEALAPPRTEAAFDRLVLKSMEDDIRDPIETDGPINIYRKHVIGRRYVAASDTGMGVSRDDSVTVIMDYDTGYIVADLVTNLIPPDEFALLSMKMLELYGRPLWAPENIPPGNSVVEAARRARYLRLFKEEKGEKYGWTPNSLSRPIMWNDLAEAIKARHIIIPNSYGLNQFYNIVYNARRNGVEAMEGARDDYPTAVGIAWQARARTPGRGGNFALMPAAF